MLKRLLMLGGILLAVADAFANPAKVSTWIAQGDVLYPLRAEAAQNKQALVFYEKAIAEDPSQAEPYWKASRAAWWTGTRLLDTKERTAFFQKGIQFGKEATQRAPDSAEAHFWLGGNYSSYGHEKGAFTSLSLIRTIRRELAEVNRLNDRYMAGGAYRILGILDYKVPGFLSGNKQRALERLQKSLAMDTQNPVTIFYIADYYASVGDKETARKTLKQLDNLHPTPDFAPELPLMQKQAKDLSAKL